MECNICGGVIDGEYTKINNCGENGIFHRDCLETWIDEGEGRGITTQSPFETYLLISPNRTKVIRIKQHSNLGEPYDPLPWCFFALCECVGACLCLIGRDVT